MIVVSAEVPKINNDVSRRFTVILWYEPINRNALEYTETDNKVCVSFHRIEITY